MTTSGTNQKQKLIFFGNERLATGVTTDAPILKGLLRAGYDITALVVSHSKPKSRHTKDLEVLQVAKDHGIEIIVAPKILTDLNGKLESLQAEAGVLAAFGKIVPESTINLFPHGIINIHPSLLPLHRGPTPLESVILDGSSVTGVSIMELVKEMDAGPVYAYSEHELSGHESKQELADELSELGAAILLDVLPMILSGKAIAKPQDESRATYDKLISKADGKIDWSKSSEQLAHEVRAYAGWPKSTAEIAGKEVIITQSKSSDTKLSQGQVSTENQRLTVGCGHGSLEILRLKPAGKQEMNAEQFIRGYSSKLSS